MSKVPKQPNPSDPQTLRRALNKFIDLVAFWSKSGDKDMRTNWAIDGFMLICGILLFQFVGIPLMKQLGSLGQWVIGLGILWLIYQLLYRALRGCWELFTEKMDAKGYKLGEL